MSDKVGEGPDAVENPRTTRVRKIALDAAVTLFIDEGFRAVTAQRVSQATGVARSTIYRIWPDQVALLLETIDGVAHPQRIVETTGDLGVDLTAALVSLRRRLDDRPIRDIFAALLEHANRSDEIVPVQRRFVAGIVAPVSTIVTEAISDGRLVVATSVDDVVAQLTGPLFQQHVMMRQPITDDLIAASVKAVVDSGIGRRPGSSGRARKHLEPQET